MLILSRGILHGIEQCEYNLNVPTGWINNVWVCNPKLSLYNHHHPIQSRAVFYENLRHVLVHHALQTYLDMFPCDSPRAEFGHCVMTLKSTAGPDGSLNLLLDCFYFRTSSTFYPSLARRKTYNKASGVRQILGQVKDIKYLSEYLNVSALTFFYLPSSFFFEQIYFRFEISIVNSQLTSRERRRRVAFS